MWRTEVIKYSDVHWANLTVTVYIFSLFFHGLRLSAVFHCLIVSQYSVFEVIFIMFVCTGRSMEIKTEADSTDITEHPHDDKSKPYSCTVCVKRYRTSQELGKHRNIHTDKYKCIECGKRFQDNIKLAVHSRTHSGDKPFECFVCGKRFTTAGNLTVHSRIHSGEKPFKCSVCDMAFSQFVALDCHMKVHTGERPYKCLACDKCFRQPSTLQKHVRLVHSKWRKIMSRS